MSKTKDDIKHIIEGLDSVYDLRFFEDKDPYRVLIRTILSQRTRDENTDKATAKLFSVYKDIYEVADAPVEEIEKLVKSAGFYRVKAGRIKEVSRILIDQFGGAVPDNMKELLTLHGVGRKTANCVLVYAFEEPAIPVDTHVHRISNLLGLTDTKDPKDTEEELVKIVPKDDWLVLNDYMVQFGQTICKPNHMECDRCPISEYCDYNHNEI